MQIFTFIGTYLAEILGGGTVPAHLHSYVIQLISAVKVDQFKQNYLFQLHCRSTLEAMRTSLHVKWGNFFRTAWVRVLVNTENISQWRSCLCRFLLRVDQRTPTMFFLRVSKRNSPPERPSQVIYVQSGHVIIVYA